MTQPRVEGEKVLKKEEKGYFKDHVFSSQILGKASQQAYHFLHFHRLMLETGVDGVRVVVARDFTLMGTRVDYKSFSRYEFSSNNKEQGVQGGLDKIR